MYNKNSKIIIAQNKNAIISDYQSGMTSREVGSKYNISNASVLKILKNNNIPSRSTKGLKLHTNRAIVPLEIFTSQQGTPDFDYFLGILATDGNIYNNMIRAEFAPNNIEILENFKEFLQNKVTIHSRVRKSDNRTYYKICFKNQKIVDYLKTFGITPNKTFSIKLSYINWNVLRGIFDGDGTIVEDTRKTHSWKFSICSASIDFINQLNDFYVENGLHPIVYRQRNYYTIHIGRLEEIYYIYTNIYKDSSYFLKRKYDKFCPLVEKFTRQFSVNSVKERENY